MYWKKSPEALFEELSTSPCGLSSSEAADRLKRFGLNEIRKEKRRSVLLLLIDQFADPLIYLLIFAAAFTLFIREYIDSIVIFAALLLNAVVGFLQEYKAERSLEAIRKLAAVKARVIRDCMEGEINAGELVPGDIVTLFSGDKVPADSRLFEAKDLNVDEAILTGESEPVEKNTAALAEDRPALAEIANTVFMGTSVTVGRAKALVLRTGRATELGKISERVRGMQKEKTPLEKKMAAFTRVIGLSAVGLSLLVYLAGLLKGYLPREMLLFSISMAVSAIPEGLPVVITVTMAVGLTVMARKNVIIRKLVAVETLGSCDYICADKTGTITENCMTVTKAWAGGKEYEFGGIGYDMQGEISSGGGDAGPDTGLRTLLLAGLLCNDARLRREGDAWKVSGDPTEAALIVSAAKFGLSGEAERRKFPRVEEIPFSSGKRFMAVVVRKGAGCIILVKGAPEKLLSFCGKEKDAELNAVQERFARGGLRVLGFGMKVLDYCPDKESLGREAVNGLRFLGFQGEIDPPRKSAVEAIRKTRTAGITTVMITGDNKLTAQTIAMKAGILGEGGLVVTGREIDRETGLLRREAERIRVYARVSPEHKLRIVQALQEKKAVVAMTGDGVNDAPALKRADIGVSMGRTGTDVAREASDMILKDDNFASILEAVRQGRIIFDNIRKVTFFLLSSAAGEAVAIVFSLALNLPLPFLAAQILWINVVTNGLQDVALAFEPGEAGILDVPPRDPRENILTAPMLVRLALIGAVLGAGTLFILWLKLAQGYSVDYARTAAFNTMVFFQFFNLLVSRSFNVSIFRKSLRDNPLLFYSMIAALAAQICVLTVPGLQFVFHTRPLDLQTWVHMLAVSSLLIVITEVDKLFFAGRR